MSHDTYPSTADRATALHMHSSGLPQSREAAHLKAEPACASHPLTRLRDALDAAFEQSADAADPSQCAAFALAVRAALAEAAADPALLAPAQHGGAADAYRRHLLAADPHGRYAIAALVWMPGQASPVHAHQTWCGYVVLKGALAESLYDWDDAQQCARETRTHPRASGAVSFVRAGRGAIHRLGNASGSPAISLHIYGVAGARIGTHVNDLLQVADMLDRIAEQAIG